MNNLDMFEKIEKDLKEIDRISNPPFSTKSIKQYLKKKSESFGFNLISNPYYSYIHVNNKPGCKKLVLFSHTDHPAFVFKDSDSGILFGKFDIDKVINNVPIEIQVFDRNGQYVFDEVINVMNGREFKISGMHRAKSNYSARFKINEEVVEGKLGMYSADNYLGTYSLIHLLENESLKNSEFDLYFVFNHFEEVYQLGSFKFGQDNALNIGNEDYIVNIDTWREGSDDKLLLQTLEKGCVYGMWSGEGNKAEILAKNSALEVNIKYDIGINSGSGDARVLDYFQLTPNLISIGIPRDRYHNISTDGEIGYEVLSIPTFNQLLLWLEAICLSKNIDELTTGDLRNKERLKQYHDVKFIEESISSNLTVSKKYEEAVKRGYFFHQNLFEKLLYWLKLRIGRN